jgi:HPt (histidine-containing phosphotransfer) domain-containing protein
MNDHVTKPIERKALVQSLRRWLPRRQHAADGDGASGPVAGSVSPSTVAARADGGTVEGVDIAGSLRRLGLEYDTFRRMLVKFADGQGPTLDALRSAVAAGDGAAAARHAHAIAGASGNLGAEALHVAAKALEREGRAGGDRLAELLAELEQRAAVVFSSIDGLRGGRPAAAAEPGPAPTIPIEARPVLERLQAALGDFDLTAASRAFADLERVGMPGHTGDLARLRTHIDGYEYDEARALVISLLEQVGSRVS